MDLFIFFSSCCFRNWLVEPRKTLHATNVEQVVVGRHFSVSTVSANSMMMVTVFTVPLRLLCLLFSSLRCATLLFVVYQYLKDTLI